MSSPAVRIEADFLAPWLLRLAADLAWREELGVSVGPVRGSGPPPPGVLRVQRASLVGPAVTVLGPAAVRSPAATDVAVRLGASDLAWRGPSHSEPWLLRAGPLPTLWSGRPDPARSWALVASDVSSHRDRIDALAAENDLQVHEIVGMSRRGIRGAVRWAAGPSGLASLLGKMSVVFARSGPLAWDAARAGALVVDPSPDGPERAARESWALRRLAHVVPYPLVHHRAFWAGLVADLRVGRVSGWGTDAWAARARDVTNAGDGATLPSLDRLQRKLRKLRRDPGAFLADSRLPWLRQLARSRGHG